MGLSPWLGCILPYRYDMVIYESEVQCKYQLTRPDTRSYISKGLRSCLYNVSVIKRDEVRKVGVTE